MRFEGEQEFLGPVPLISQGAACGRKWSGVFEGPPVSLYSRISVVYIIKHTITIFFEFAKVCLRLCIMFDEAIRSR